MNDPFKANWDIIIMILAVFNCFTIPFAIAWDPDLFNEWYFVLINYLIDLVFLIDLVINCRTTYISKTGEEVRTPKKILREQLKGRFWVDLLASIPLDEFSEVNYELYLYKDYSICEDKRALGVWSVKTRQNAET